MSCAPTSSYASVLAPELQNSPSEKTVSVSLKGTRPSDSLDQLPFDVIGVGFGPSNLALAAALDEKTQPGPRVHFYECHPKFSWHGGMLLAGATMQVHFLKDLVTLRNPVSRFGFLSYLHDRERLVDFINHKALFPSRVEFHDYLEWAAGLLADYVSYGCEVTRIEPGTEPHESGYLRVRFNQAGTDVGASRVRHTRSVVLAPGLQPRLPSGVSESERVWHSSGLLGRLEGLAADKRWRFTIVGAGQSAAEVAAYLHSRYPQSQVRAVLSPYGYTPADDSPFVNHIFDPSAVGEFYQAPGTVRRMLSERHSNTNYSVVDQELIEALYSTWYQEKVVNERRLLIDNTSRVLDVTEEDGCLSLTIETLTTGDKRAVESDFLVYATGYRPTPPEDLLAPDLLRLCRREKTGQLSVARDYRLCMKEGVPYDIYLQGATDYTHGLSSTLLSNTAVRAGEIADSLSCR